MSAGCRIVCLIAAVLPFAGAARAGEAKQVQRVYSVADLVIPIGEPAGERPDGRTTAWAVSREKQGASPVGVAVTVSRPPATREDKLIRTITRTIAPCSWSDKGGAGTIDYFPLTMSLVVNQTPAIQDQIGDLLNALRRQQEMEVVVEVKFVDISAEVMEDLRQRDLLGASGDKPHARGDATFLDDAGVRRFLDAIQEDVRSNVMQAPKMTMFNGQKVAINSGDEQHFVTGLEIVAVGNHIEYRPKEETVPLGIQMGLQPVVSEDRRSVRVNFQTKLTSLESGDVPMFPITTPAPEETQGPDGKPKTVTHYIQQPRVVTFGVDKTLLVPDGHTAVLSAGTRNFEGRCEYGTPILCDLPCIGRLFRNVGYSRETHHVLVLVTPRIRVQPEQEEKRTKFVPCDNKKACSCGRADWRTPTVPPIRPEQPGDRDEPSEASILRALPPVVRVPGVCEESRDNIQIVTERLAEKVDPPRFFPLVGPARLHHYHWKCTVYYNENINGSYPFAFRCSRIRSRVVYVDSDHLHACADGEK